MISIIEFAERHLENETGFFYFFPSPELEAVELLPRERDAGPVIGLILLRDLVFRIDRGANLEQPDSQLQWGRETETVFGGQFPDLLFEFSQQLPRSVGVPDRDFADRFRGRSRSRVSDGDRYGEALDKSDFLGRFKARNQVRPGIGICDGED